MLGGVFLYQCQIALTLIVGALCQFLVHPVQPFLHTGDVGKGFLGFLTHGGMVLQDHHLRQITDPTVIGDAHRTSRWLLLAAENLQQGRLTGSVLAHKGNAVTVVDDKTGISEQRLHAKLHLKSFY